MPTIPVQTRLAPPSAFTAGHSEPRLGAAAPSASAPRGPSPAPAGAVSLHIDSLVLHGFPAAEARRVGAAFEKELTRLLTEFPLSESTLHPSLHPLTSASEPGSAHMGHWSLDIGPSGARGAGAARALHARLRA